MAPHGAITSTYLIIQPVLTTFPVAEQGDLDRAPYTDHKTTAVPLMHLDPPQVSYNIHC